ncbi:molybdopterin molybdenumtransferase MoeA [Pseudolabrys taiwanensis]|uniref:Molybdopterin molybdenumtransferase n=1 Tax=Pseudolabrys taiwanensis TaxID=331696 RepID=A0A346A128_9HYPH|nr:gephyrin-like molybdotransferase Glp [Pseudolabrys taiwanensis]AXK82875.1 molybdopterin molybdenumtransferase MoeA [Pseudolabrys taiwanensis]
MAQLTDDCFAFSGPLLRLDDMERLIAERITPVKESEVVALGGARGRVLVSDVVAPVDLPPFDNSAVDGYAVRHADLNKEADTRLTIAGRVTAGRAADAAIGKGEAVRIFTGAPMPAGADTVFMQEDVTVDGETVVVPKGLKLGANRRLAGEDVPKGQTVLPAGTVLEPQHIALAAALGITSLDVRRRLTVAIFSTGDEVVEPGKPLGRAAIYDANRYLLRELLERLGAVVTDLGIIADQPEALAHALQAAARTHDLIVTSGGVSTGEADYVRTAVERIGSLVFWRVAIKPGRPVALGVIRDADDSAAFIGLPGNPVAVFVTFVRVVRPLLRQLAGARADVLTPLPVRSSFAYKKKKDRREYVRVALRRGADGELEAVKHPQDGAGVLTSLTQTDGLLELPEDITTVAPGDRVGFLSYASLIG